MHFLDSRSVEERFAELLERSNGFLRRSGIDVADYRALAKQESVQRAVAALLDEAERKNLLLPPGYWQSLHRLHEEAKMNSDEKTAS